MRQKIALQLKIDLIELQTIHVKNQLKFAENIHTPHFILCYVIFTSYAGIFNVSFSNIYGIVFYYNFLLEYLEYRYTNIFVLN